MVWKGYQRRAETLAPLLNADVVFMPHHFAARWLRPIDYLIKAIRTARLLKERRPGFAIFQSPPPFGALVAATMKIPFVVDAHNATFQGRWATSPGASMALRRAAAVAVHNEEVAALAGHAFPGIAPTIVPDPVPPIVCEEVPERRQDQVLCICSFGTDEPVDVLVEAIELMPELTFVITANPERLGSETRARLLALENVQLTGFLSTDEYQRALVSSRAAVVLTNREATQPSGACEALASDTPLVLSRTTLTEKLFGTWARLVPNEPAAIAAAVRATQPTLDLADERARWNKAVSSGVSEIVNRATGVRVPESRAARDREA